MKQIKITTSDGSHHGLTDWYPTLEKDIKSCMAGKGDFTTGWYSSKKEIASANITRIKGVYQIQVSVSDDFDTEGLCIASYDKIKTLDALRQAIDKTWDGAEENRRENKTYVGWSIGLRSGKKHRGKNRISWIETYIQCTDGSDEYDIPPAGDYYHKWGFQGDTKISRDIKKRIESIIHGYGTSPFYVDDYIDRWED